MNEITKAESETVTTDYRQLPLPIADFEPAAVVRPEYNIGKYAGIIFTSPHSKRLGETLTHEWRVEEQGTQAEASLSVIPLQGFKRPTTTTLRIYLGLIQIWEHQGKPADGVIRFSARQLANVIGWKWAGKDTANRIYSHLQSLAGTSLSWVLSFKQPSGQYEKIRSNMSIISSAEYRVRGQLFEPEMFSCVQRVVLNPDLVANMLQGHVRPLNYKAFMAIGSDTTANLYARIDVYLAKKRRWERRAVELLRDELGLVGKRYEQRRIRHAKLKELAEQLDGVELFSGKLRTWVEKTADGEDYKLVAEKVKRINKKRPELKRFLSKEDAALLADELIKILSSIPKSGKTKRGYMIFLCQYYPELLLRDALNRAKADYRENVKKSLGACFTYELEQEVRMRGDLNWFKDVQVELS